MILKLFCGKKWDRSFSVTGGQGQFERYSFGFFRFLRQMIGTFSKLFNRIRSLINMCFKNSLDLSDMFVTIIACTVRARSKGQSQWKW